MRFKLLDIDLSDPLTWFLPIIPINGDNASFFTNALNYLLNLIKGVLEVLLYPINILFENIFPNLNTGLLFLNRLVTNYISPLVSWFFNLFPSNFKNLFVLWLTFVISYYTIYWTYLAAIKVFSIIRKVKFW